jgi:predicted nucleic-acid-binding Zn-ribbon protein
MADLIQYYGDSCKRKLYTEIYQTALATLALNAETSEDKQAS